MATKLIPLKRRLSKQPSANATLNPSFDYDGKIVFAHQLSTLKDLSGNNHYLYPGTTNALLKPGIDGMVYRGTGTQTLKIKNNISLPSGQVWTAVARFSLTSGTSGTALSLQDGTTTTALITIGVGTNGYATSANMPMILGRCDSATRKYTTGAEAGLTAINDGLMHTIGAKFDGTNLFISQDGRAWVQVANSTGSFTGFTINDTGSTLTYLSTLSGDVSFGLLTAKMLSQDDMARLHANPWQILNVAANKGYFAPVSGAVGAIGASGSATATGSANLGINIAIGSSGSVTATGAANITTASGVSIVSTGSATATGTANLGIGIGLISSGSATATGTANITTASGVSIAASGTATVTGTANLGLTIGIVSSGAAIATGAANIIGYTNPAIVASGTSAATGTANILPASANSIVASGSLTATGSANLGIKIGIVSTGAMSATGTANLIGYTNVAIVSSGNSVATGSANLTTAAATSISATGSVSATGSANFGVVIGFNATGMAIATGTANLTTAGGLVYFTALGSAVFTGTATMRQSVKFSALGSVIATGQTSFNHDASSFKRWLIAMPMRNSLIIESSSNRIIVDR